MVKLKTFLEPSETSLFEVKMPSLFEWTVADRPVFSRDLTPLEAQKVLVKHQKIELLNRTGKQKYWKKMV